MSLLPMSLARHIEHLGPFTTSEELAQLGGMSAELGLPPRRKDGRSYATQLARLLSAVREDIGLGHVLVPGSELVLLESLVALAPGTATTVWLPASAAGAIAEAVARNMPVELEGETLVVPQLPTPRGRGVAVMLALGLYGGFLSRVPADTRTILDHLLGTGLRTEVVLLDPVGQGARTALPGWKPVYTSRAFTHVYVEDARVTS